MHFSNILRLFDKKIPVGLKSVSHTEKNVCVEHACNVILQMKRPHYCTGIDIGNVMILRLNVLSFLDDDPLWYHFPLQSYISA